MTSAADQTNGRATPDRIVDAGLRLFADKGFQGTTVGEIERQAGLTPRAGALYRHFPSKEAVLEAAFERHVRLGRACREGIKAMGLDLFSPDDDSAAVVTAARTPEGVDAGEFLLLLRDRHGVTLAPGQGELKGKIFRIGHIGYFDVFDIATALAAVELALTELGADVERGVAVTRALEAYDEPVHA